MATRSERVDEALELVAGHEALLELLALNEIPLRRNYFNEVSGIDAPRVVKLLAKLANAAMLEETDGLLFRIVAAEEAEEIRGRIAPERRRQLHEDSLAWAEGKNGLDPRFVVGHLIGAERHDQAARLLIDLLGPETDAFRAKAWLARLKLTLDSMLDAGDQEPALLREVAVLYIQRAGKELKSRELSRLNSRLKELDVSEDDRLLFDALTEQAAQARAAEAAARRATEQAAAAAATQAGEAAS